MTVPEARSSSCRRSNSLRVKLHGHPAEHHRSGLRVQRQPVVAEDRAAGNSQWRRKQGVRSFCRLSVRAPRPPHHRSDSCTHLPRPEGFGDVIIGTALKRGQQIRLLSPPSEHHDVSVGELTDPAQHLKTVNIGQPHVQGHNIWSLFPNDFHTLATTHRRVDDETGLKEHTFHEVPHIQIIFNYYSNAQVAHGPPLHRITPTQSQRYSNHL